MLLKVSEKILSDRHTCIVPLFYRFTLLLLHHWYCYCHRIVLVIKIIWILIDLNNNIKRQLILGLEKLVEEIVSVFWINLGYMLRSRDIVSLQSSGG